jgi:hypothetical protein
VHHNCGSIDPVSISHRSFTISDSGLITRLEWMAYAIDHMPPSELLRGHRIVSILSGAQAVKQQQLRWLSVCNESAGPL